MHTIETIIRKINREIVPEFENKLRESLKQQSKEWLIEQVIRLTLDAHSLKEMDRKTLQDARDKEQRARISRLKRMKINEGKLKLLIEQYRQINRQWLEEREYLVNPPHKGTAPISKKHRTRQGSELLAEAKDVLFAILYGTENMGVDFDRVDQELLSVTIPRHKVDSLNFMNAATEIGGMGKWQDPEGISSDERADNIILQVEYGNLESGIIGDGILTTLSIINNLEINEQVLYARMVNVEQSSLIT